MDEARSGGEDRPEDGSAEGVPEGPWGPLAGPPPPSEPDPLAAEEAEVRQLIEAGASSPEELRALAARLRELRQREEAKWRSEVKPALLKEKKGRLRRSSAPPPPVLPVEPDPLVSTTPEVAPQSRLAWVVAGLLVMAGLALFAANTTVWVLILPVLGLLAWAWVQGQGRDDA